MTRPPTVSVTISLILGLVALISGVITDSKVGVGVGGVVVGAAGTVLMLIAIDRYDKETP